MAETLIRVTPMTEEQQDAMKRILKHGRKLNRHEYNELKGQVEAGEPEAAMRGLTTILTRDLDKNYWKKHKKIVFGGG